MVSSRLANLGVKRVSLTVLVDNDVYREGFMSSWGLSIYARIHYSNDTVYKLLFDLDTSYNVLRHNMDLSNIGFNDIDAIFISHWHGDHCGPLDYVLENIDRDIPVYVPSKPFLWSYRKWRKRFIVCSNAMEIVDNIYTTGCLGYGIREHSLAIVLGDKIVVLVGCSHPGIVDIVKRALDVTGLEKARLVIGGFHLSGWSEGEYVAKELYGIVDYIAPIHCTGYDSRRAIESVFRDRYVKAGSGYTIELSI